MMNTVNMAKWSLLTEFLNGVEERVTLTWPELDSIVGSVPASASKYRAWWGSGHSHVRSWTSAGFEFTNLQMGLQVTFIRTGSATPTTRTISRTASTRTVPAVFDQYRAPSPSHIADDAYVLDGAINGRRERSGLKVFWSFIFGMPMVFLGLLLCASVWLFPVGLLVIWLGCLPFYRTQMAAVKRQVDREMQPRTKSAKVVVVNHERETVGADIVLVSCVKTKQAEAAKAKDLYTSDLFRKERSYAERVGVPWYILSAEYGLVAPDQWVSSYERYLPEESQAYRDAWGLKVVADLEQIEGPLQGKVIEIHAAIPYIAAIRSGLQSRGAIITEPWRGLGGIGKIKHWYGVILAQGPA